MLADLITLDIIPLLTNATSSPAHGQGWCWQPPCTCCIWIERWLCLLLAERRMETICIRTEPRSR